MKGYEQAFDEWHTSSMDYPEEAVFGNVKNVF